MQSSDALDVTLEVLVPPKVAKDEHEQIARSVERVFLPMIDEMRPGREVADALNLPTAVPVDFRLTVVPAPEHASEDPDQRAAARVPVRATIRGGPSLAHEQFEAVSDSLGDLLYESIRPLEVPEELVDLVGHARKRPVRFELQFAHDEAKATTLGDTAVAQYCEAGYYSWSKGCSSWPW